MSSLLLANIPTQKSTDRGVTIQRNPAGSATSGVPVDDRQWNEFHGNEHGLHALPHGRADRLADPALDRRRPDLPAARADGRRHRAGRLHRRASEDGHRLRQRLDGSGLSQHFDSAHGRGRRLSVRAQAATDPNGVAHIFFPVKVADDGTPNGTVYVAYSNDHDVFLVHSTDKGVTWSAPVRVSNGAETKTAVFPWLETGPTPGSVGIVWYGTTNATNDDNANWKVFYAQSFNATSDTPTFRQAK
jgi:hypothetical protein